VAALAAALIACAGIAAARKVESAKADFGDLLPRIYPPVLQGPV